MTIRHLTNKNPYSLALDFDFENIFIRSTY